MTHADASVLPCGITSPWPILSFLPASMGQGKQILKEGKKNGNLQ